MIPPRIPASTTPPKASRNAPRDGSIGGVGSSRRNRVQAPRASADGIAMQELATTWPVGSPAMRVLVMLPTYNEIENIQDVLERARAALPDADVLVIDDGSPDGTADHAEKLGEELGGIDVLRRAGEVGPRLGVPRRVPRRARPRLRRDDRDGRRPLARPGGAPRARRRGRARRRPRHRIALRARRCRSPTGSGCAARSRVAAASTPRTMLGLSVHDATAGFRAYHRRQPLAASTSTASVPTATASRSR